MPLALQVSACYQFPSSQVIARVPTTPTERSSGGDWVHVRVPGWFAVDMPAAPRESLNEQKYWIGVAPYKALVADMYDQGDGLRCVIGYRELFDREDAKKLIASDVDDIKHRRSVRGVTVQPAASVTAGGARATEISMRVEPGSPSSTSPVAFVTRLRLLAVGFRELMLECSEPADQPAGCDRFFEAFHLDRAP
jgi:hypothetical protein